MSHRALRSSTLLSLFLLLPLPGHAAESCKLNRLATVPVTMDGLVLTAQAQINGKPALFRIDSGALWSMLSPASAQQYQLPLDYDRVPGLYVQGLGGTATAAVTRVKTFTLSHIPFHNIDFIVGGSEPGRGTVGLIGQNILRRADVEYDLAQGTLNFFEPENCRHASLDYWVKHGDPDSEMDIERTTPDAPYIAGKINLNGAKTRVVFDTGAPTSTVGLRAAAAAGFKPGDPGVEPAGYTTGIGRKTVRTWTVTFPVLKIGDEEIHHARLHVGDLGTFDMLLGADFFLSHRIFVAISQDKLYFTYNGGPVFALNEPRQAGSSDAPLADAAEIARRAAASASRHDFEHALADFNRACELAPEEASYFYQRALVEFAIGQQTPATNDLDRALTLKPDYVDALVRRAEYRQGNHDTAAALTDLDTVDRVAPKEADVRLTLGSLYGSMDRWAQAITQTDLWIAVHEQDPRVVKAYNVRCWARALLGTELDKALRDCNAGLRLGAHTPQLLESRGLVNLRRNQYDKAIADYNEALKISPKIAWSLYGRGIAELRKGMTAQAEADIAAAKAIAPTLAEHAQQFGINP